MIVAVPSKGRAGRTTTQKIVPNATFYVPESEVHQYAGMIKNVIGVPKTVKGITATRNWVLENTVDPRIVFLDDDVKNAGYAKMHDRNAQQINITDEAVWIAEFAVLFDVTEQMGYKIWGVKTEAATRSNYIYKPFLFQSYVTASCMGIINDGEYRFDESFKVKEDYEICLRHIRDKGGILAARYLHWMNDHWGKDGGCKDYRTIEIERDAIKRLIKMYPSMVKSAKRRANEFTIQLTF